MTNADKAQPERVIVLDRPRKFILDLNAFCLLEEKLEREAKAKHHLKQLELINASPTYKYQPWGGLSVFDVINWQTPGLRDMRLILWAGLLRDDENLTLEHLNEMLTFEKMGELAPLIQELVMRAMPPAEEKKEIEEGAEEKKSEPHLEG